MQTTITERGQISIPSEVRKKLNLKPGMGIEWLISERGIYLYPIPDDPIKAFRASLKAPGLLDDLLADRQKERLRERKK